MLEKIKEIVSWDNKPLFYTTLPPLIISAIFGFFGITTAFLLGLGTGSYIATGLDRLTYKQTVLKMSWRRLDWDREKTPLSHCFSCGHHLEPKDVVPLVSYILCKGRCKYCGIEIPRLYPIIELATGLTFLVIWLTVRDILKIERY